MAKEADEPQEATREKNKGGHPKSVKTAAAEYYERMLPEFGEIDEPTRSVLHSYALTCCQIDEVNRRLTKEGLLIETERGTRENPAVSTLHKLNADKARYYTPLKRVLDRHRSEAEENAYGQDDEFMGF